MSNIVFQVKCSTQPGEDVRVVGCSSQLGDWMPARGVRLQTTPDTYPFWKSESIALSEDTEYKYVVVKSQKEGEVRWEGCANRRIPTTNHYHSITVEDCFGDDSAQNVRPTVVERPKEEEFDSHCSAQRLFDLLYAWIDHEKQKMFQKMQKEQPNKAAALDESLERRIKGIVHQSPVMLLMEGNPETSRGGKSGDIVYILNKEGISFGSFDVRSDNDIWQGIKEYSKWPTYPQLYVEGKLIGGLEIAKALHEEGALKYVMDSAFKRLDLSKSKKSGSTPKFGGDFEAIEGKRLDMDFLDSPVAGG